MDSTDCNADVLVIGAGMAGLIAARELREAGRSVTILDKGRGPGGRMATRRIGNATFDHGAQCFTLTESLPGSGPLRQRLGESLVEWLPPTAPGTDSRCRWRGTPSMSAIAKHLAHGLDLHLETPVTALHQDRNCWIATTPAGGTFAASAILLTPPVPQALALLDTGGFAPAPELRSRLDAIEYDRCLAVLAVLEGPSHIPPPGALAPASGPLAWITDNQLKGISSETAVTLHATPAFSLEHWDRDRTETGHLLLAAAAEWLGAPVRSFQVHGWRYSQARVVDADRCLTLRTRPPLVLAGDGFGGGGVDGAALSGLAAAKTILALGSETPPRS